MVNCTFRVLLEPAEEGGVIVRCIELPVATQGETKEEALTNVKETIEGPLEVKATRLERKAISEKTEIVIEAFCSRGVK